IEWQNEFGILGKGINNMSQNIKELMNTAVENEKKKREIEFKMLQSQINPHFMYNTLNSIRWMATIQNAPGIAEMVTAFASLLRNISNRNDEMITLRQELSFLEDYFTVQKYRYGGSVSMIVEKEDDSLTEALIPRFTLQPLIENAIFHGIEPKGNAGVISIKISSDYESEISVVVKDDGTGIPEDKLATILTNDSESGKGLFKQVGLSNVHKRLQLVFGEEYGLSVESSEGEYTAVTVHIPYKASEAE
ncbi:MAG: sensor histidine kinase, partial [Treponemataceae bacterium]|nr:sensor histidine kinase [Treponemataceae bacterium]